MQRDPLIYLPYTGESASGLFVIARTHVPAATLTEAFRREAPNRDQTWRLLKLKHWRAGLRSGAWMSALGVLFTSFAFVALLLAAVGLYAVIAHSVSQRTQEIGIRMAMGGNRRDILGLVLVQAMRPVTIGLAVGSSTRVGVTRVLRAALVGVAPGDPITFAGVVLVMVGTGLLGCAIPARRATRVDPLVALRCE